MSMIGSRYHRWARWLQSWLLFTHVEVTKADMQAVPSSQRQAGIKMKWLY